MIKVGIVGVGHLGEIHLKLILKSEAFKLVGFYDDDINKSILIEKKYGIPAYKSCSDLSKDIEAVIICTPTLFHYETAKSFFKTVTYNSTDMHIIVCKRPGPN